MNSDRKKRRSFFIKSHGPDKNAIKLGFKWLARKDNATESQGLIAAPDKSTINDGIISECLGDKATKKLTKDYKLTLPIGENSIELHLITKKKLVKQCNGPILAIYPDKDLLNKIDTINGVTNILVIPWHLDEVEDWIDVWGAKELDEKGNALEEPAEDNTIIMNPVVEDALKSLTTVVNLSTGIAHPNDQSRTIDMFEKLKEAGERYDLKDVRKWLIRKGKWEPKHAADVIDIGHQVMEGKKLKKTVTWDRGVVDRWLRKDKNKS